MGSAVLTNQSKWWLCCLVSLFQLLDSLYLEFQHQAVPLQTTMTTLEITMIQPETFQEITLALEITMILLETILALEIAMILLETTLALEITMIPLETFQEITMIPLETFQEITMIQPETTLALEITMILLETIQEITMMLPEIMMGMLLLVELIPFLTLC